MNVDRHPGLGLTDVGAGRREPPEVGDCEGVQEERAFGCVNELLDAAALICVLDGWEKAVMGVVVVAEVSGV